MGVLAVFAALQGWASRAHAEDIDLARKRFAEGIRLYQGGDWEGARRAFREADAEHHAPAIVYNVGLAEEKLSHAQAAVDMYEAYVGEAGDDGEFVASAIAAIARIKSRSTRLRLETHPPGARIFVDGTVLDEHAPTSLLVPAGHHVVVVEGDGWRDERIVEARGAADHLGVVFDAPARADEPPSATRSEADRSDTRARSEAAPTTPPVPDAITWGAAFAVIPTYLLGATNPIALNDRPLLSLFAGPLVEFGYAVTERLEFLFRGMLAIGQAGIPPTGKPSTMFMGGPGFSWRPMARWWFGGAFTGGKADTGGHGVPYSTDLVFGGILEASVVVYPQAHGEWLVGVQPSVLWANTVDDNFALFVPVTFGYRAY
jgi:hypothetical protein